MLFIIFDLTYKKLIVNVFIFIINFVLINNKYNYR